MMKRFRIRKRQESPPWHSCLVVTVAVLLALFCSSVLLLLRGTPPVEGMKVLFLGAFGSQWAIEDSLLKAIPLFLCSLGVATAFRLRIWNIGAEGQFALGAIGATWMALSFPEMSGVFLLPLMLLMACLAGGLWGVIPAALRQYLGTNEIISSLMLNYIAVFLLDFLVYGIWKDPTSFGFPVTPEFSEHAIVGKIGDSMINWGILHCLVLGICFWIFFSRTRWGFQLKVAGENVRAAQYARVPYTRLVLVVMMLSGALAGWAGLLEASATIGRLQPSIMVGYGYTAIVVAWLARLNPLNIAIASFLLAGLRVGVENLQLDLQVPAAFGVIMEGFLLIAILASGFFIQYRLVKVESTQEEGEA